MNNITTIYVAALGVQHGHLEGTKSFDILSEWANEVLLKSLPTHTVRFVVPKDIDASHPNLTGCGGSPFTYDQDSRMVLGCRSVITTAHLRSHNNISTIAQRLESNSK